MAITYFMCCLLTQAFNLTFVLPKHCCRDSQLIKPRQAPTHIVYGFQVYHLSDLRAFDEQLLILLPGLTAIIEHKVQITDLTCSLSSSCNSFFTLNSHYRGKPVQKAKEQHPTQENPPICFYFVVFLPDQPLQ